MSAAESRSLLVRREGDVLHLTLNRPQAYNAIDAELRDALISAFDGAEGQGARAILLDAAGRGFCAGIDLKSLANASSGLSIATLMRGSTHRLVRSIVDCPLPLVSAVHGTVAGIGMTLALAADVCLAAADATFRPAFVERSIVPDGAAAYILPRLVGMARAKDILLRRRELGAEEAVAMGLIAETAPAEGLPAHAATVAEELAQLPTATVSLLKEMLARSFENGLESVLLEERLSQALASTTADAAEGRASFIERRPPEFRGS